MIQVQGEVNSQGFYKFQPKKRIKDIIEKSGVISGAFNVSFSKPEIINSGTISKEINKVSDTFNKGEKLSPFKNSGVMFGGKFYSVKTDSIKTDEKTLDSVLEKTKVDKSFYIDKNKKVKRRVIPQIDREPIVIETEYDMWDYLKGRKNQYKINKTSGFKYKYGEGKMIFPDPRDKPSRTIITGEGGPSPSRFKHVIEEDDGSLRRLIPIELEKLNMFPENHTEHEKVTDNKRAFFMGNALVIGVVEKIGSELSKLI